MSSPPSEPPRPDDEPTEKLPPEAEEPAPDADVHPAAAEEPAPDAEVRPVAAEEPAAAPAGTYDPFAPSAAGDAPAPAAAAAPPPPPPPETPPAAATTASYPPPERTEPTRPSLVQRTLPLAIAAVIGGAVAGGIVALFDDEPQIVVQAPSASGTANGDSEQAAPAPATPEEEQPAQPSTEQGPQEQEQQEDQPPATEEAAPQPGDAWLGISGAPVDEKLADRVRLAATEGVMVADVVPDGPADEAGIDDADGQITIDGQDYAFGGDIITAVDGEDVANIDELRRAIAEHEAGDTVELTIVRPDGEETTVDVELGARPEDGPTPSIEPLPDAPSG